MNTQTKALVATLVIVAVSLAGAYMYPTFGLALTYLWR